MKRKITVTHGCWEYSGIETNGEIEGISAKNCGKLHEMDCDEIFGVEGILLETAQGARYSGMKVEITEILDILNETE